MATKKQTTKSTATKKAAPTRAASTTKKAGEQFGVSNLEDALKSAEIFK